MGNRVVQKLYPDYQADVAELAYVHYAMQVDSRAAARQIRSPIETEHDIENAFDAITYSKGSAVLSMFERYLGEEVFREGIRRYMKAHAFATATAHDLVRALSEASHKELDAAFFSFLEQPGVPLLSVQRSCADGKASVELSQARYLPLASPVDGSSAWRIPVCMRFAKADGVGEQCTLLESARTPLSLSSGACPAWLMPNAEAAGYYRFQLPDAELAALVDAAKSQLSTREQLALLDSVEAGMRAGVLSIDSALSAYEKLGAIAQREVLEGTLEALAYVRDALLPEERVPAYRALVRTLVQPVYDRLGLFSKGEAPASGEEKLTRAMAARAMALTARVPEVRKQLAGLGRALLQLEQDEKAELLPAELHELALIVAVQDGGLQVFDRALEQLSTSEDGLTRQRLLGALAATHEEALSRRVLDLSLAEGLRTNEVLVPLARQAAMPETRSVAWAWLTEHVDGLRKRTSDHNAARMVSVFSERCSEQAAKALEQTFLPIADQIPGAPRELRLALESIRSCAALAQKDDGAASAFFAAFEGRTKKQPSKGKGSRATSKAK
jgi:alanyl aminopeptidase